ncbi:HdeD family acid-resistance protein [Aquabacter cavernae]|uniref:HdeD family acid-resistance protein n=1 Tax=Aquabacter cavernae TaxID=2496029 RepID=UPI000F8D3724|nr:protease [Aquabacter cavernae]
MVQLLLLLLGGNLIRRRWWVIGCAGFVWMVIGALFFADAFIEEIRIPVAYFAAPLIIDGVISLATIFLSRRSRMLRAVKGGVFLAVATLLIVVPHHSAFAVAMLVGTFLSLDGFWRAGSAVVVRFPGWPPSFAKGVFELLMGLWSLSPWPSNYRAEVGSDVGLLLMVSAAGLLGLAMRLRYMPADTTLSSILSTGWPQMPTTAELMEGPEEAMEPSHARRETAMVHVWTPTGAIPRLHHGIERYIAATDAEGHISTGHSALELPPGLYISHYPAQEIEQSATDFARLLRATPDNDVAGVFQPNYAEESADWCPSSYQVPIHGIDAAALRAFWGEYRRDTTYNLTNRNCSSAVVKALDAGLEGVFAPVVSTGFVMGLILSPEFWAAGMLRHRATTMAWTPGLVLDYVRALSSVLERLPKPAATKVPGQG